MSSQVQIKNIQTVADPLFISCFQNQSLKLLLEADQKPVKDL